MIPYVIIVEFEIVAGRAADFKGFILENARASLAGEPGCRQFDVLVPENEPNRIVLYEIYDDAEAFGAHTRSSHFKAFDAQSRDLVTNKRVIRLDMASPYKTNPIPNGRLACPAATTTTSKGEDQ